MAVINSSLGYSLTLVDPLTRVLDINTFPPVIQPYYLKLLHESSACAPHLRPTVGFVWPRK